MDKGVKQLLTAAAVLIGGLVVMLMGLSDLDKSTATCDGQSMQGSDKCVVIGGDSDATYDADQQLERQHKHGLWEAIGGGVFAAGAAGVLIAGFVLYVRDGQEVKARHLNAVRRAQEAVAADTERKRQEQDRARSRATAQARLPGLLAECAAAHGLTPVEPAVADMLHQHDPAFSAVRGAVAHTAVYEGSLGTRTCMLLLTPDGQGGAAPQWLLRYSGSGLPDLRVDKSEGDFAVRSGDRDFGRALLTPETRQVLRLGRLSAFALDGVWASATVDAGGGLTADDLGEALAALVEITGVLPPTWP